MNSTPSLLPSLLLALALVSHGGRSAAQESGGPPLQAVTRCQAVADDAARLACYDAAAARLTAAEQAGDVVVVNRAQVRAARRQAFGFNLPSLDILGGRDRSDEISRVTLILRSANQSPDGRWVLRTSEGQIWRQIDDRPVRRSPRPGSKAEVRNAALGSFFMNIDGQTAIRVRREQ